MTTGWPLGIATLIAWLLTASIGVYMLRTWIARGGLRRQRTTGVGVPPAVVFGHASAALTGLAIWVGYLGSRSDMLAWIGVVLISTAITLGVCTVTLWTPYPIQAGPGPAQETPLARAGGVARPVQPDAARGTAADGPRAPSAGSPQAPSAGSPQAPSAGSPRAPWAGSPRSRGPRIGPNEHPDAFTVTDEMIASLLAEPVRVRPRRRLQLLPLIPVSHGFAALTTFMLALLTAISARLGEPGPAAPPPRLGDSPPGQAGWNHGRNADNDGGTRPSRR
jgi:manganese efflux pump family protein